MHSRKIGLIGFGEVGSRFARGLKSSGASVQAYDKQSNTDAMGPRIRQRAGETGILLTETPQALAEWADVLISVTAPVVAVETVQMVAPFLRRGQIYADFNSAGPRIKQEIAARVTGRECGFADGGILGSLQLDGHKVPIVVSGPQAAALASLLNDYGMQITVIGSEPGQASALKVVRSVFTKGLEVVLLECLLAAQAFGIREPILASLVQFMESHPAGDLFAMLITTHAVHAGRRTGEMAGVLALLKECDIDATMTEATHRKMGQSAALSLGEYFKNETPKQLGEVIEAIATLSHAPQT